MLKDAQNRHIFSLDRVYIIFHNIIDIIVPCKKITTILGRLLYFININSYLRQQCLTNGCKLKNCMIILCEELRQQ